jgi:hypothetical protein
MHSLYFRPDACGNDTFLVAESKFVSYSIDFVSPDCAVLSIVPSLGGDELVEDDETLCLVVVF